MPIVFDGSAGTITGLSAGGLPSNIITSSLIAANAVTSTQIASGAITSTQMASNAISTASALNYSGAILQIQRYYDDTRSVTGGGSSPNTVNVGGPWNITLLKSGTIIMFQGIFNAHTNDDSSVRMQYQVNGGSWTDGGSTFYSTAQTYSGLGDLAWAHESNYGPFPFPIHNYFTASSIGATAGSTVGLRMQVINETSSTYTAYNRSRDGDDGSVNYATSRSFYTLMEVVA
jgi:hypothetical protein